MTLNILFAQRPLDMGPLIFADPGGGCTEAVVNGLMPELGSLTRVMLPPREDSLRPARNPPALERSWHADLWHALSDDERARIVLIAGPDAAHLAPLTGPDVRTLVFLPDPRHSIDPVRRTWPAVLGPFAALDEIPDQPEAPQERELWIERVRTATAELELLEGGDVKRTTASIANALGIGHQRTERAAAAALSASASRRPRSDRPTHWIDELLFSISRPPRRFGNDGVRRRPGMPEPVAR